MTNQLRSGYTTGTCAAAAAKASAIGLLTRTVPGVVEIETPIGKSLELTTLQESVGGGFAQCAVRKDAGDDPDVTHGCLVFARVERVECGTQPTPGIQISGGPGVGTVTKPGLQIPPGEPAVNPVPRRMITHAVAGVGLSRSQYGRPSALKVTISVPGGEGIAKNTFNPRLGIIGGISIIGTTGIVRPMSESAIKASLILSLDIAKAMGFETVVLVPGNIGEKAVLRRFSLPPEQVVLMSNYAGFMLLEAVKRGFSRVMLAGHPGKLAKLIRGDFCTHSSRSKNANDIIIDMLNGNEQVESAIVNGAIRSPTVEGIIEILDRCDRLHVFNAVADEIEEAASTFTGGGLKTGVFLFNMKREPVGVSRGAEEWQRDL